MPSAASAAASGGCRRLPGTVSRQDAESEPPGWVHGVSPEMRCSLREMRRLVASTGLVPIERPNENGGRSRRFDDANAV
jgi:hypothetical protein